MPKDFLDRIIATIKGYKIAESIIMEDDTTHYLILNRHIGDATRVLKNVILFKNYYSGGEPYHIMGKGFPKKRIVKKVVVITNELLAGVTSLFSSVDEVIILSQVELDEIDMYARSSSCTHLNLYRDEYCFDHDKANDHYKSKMYGVSTSRWNLDLPMKIPNQNEWILSDIKIKERSIIEADKILKEHDTDPKRTVILCYYAKSTSMLPEIYWIPIIEHLLVNGYHVFTNVGPTEQELSGTLRLQVSVDVLCALGLIGCYILGVQSGIVDTLRRVNADIKLLSIHYLLTHHDLVIAHNRKIEQHIERFGNITHLLLDTGAEESLTTFVKKEFAYIRKGNHQATIFKGICVENKFLAHVTTLNEYARKLIEMKHIVIYLSVCDSANKYWSSFDRNLLGLESDLSEKWRLSYIAIINNDDDFKYERVNNNYKDIWYQYSFEDIPYNTDELTYDFPEGNYSYLSSHAMGKGKYTKSAIVINGEQYSLNKRGLNIVVYSREKHCVIDSINVDLYADETLSIKRKEDFEVNANET